MKRRGRATRGEPRPPSVPVVTPADEVLDLERELDVRALQLESASGVYARGQSRY